MDDYELNEVTSAINSPWSSFADKVTTLVLGEGITSVSNCAFLDFYRLETVTFPSSLTSIGENAFSLCGFRELTIPGTVTEIGPDAFSWCYRLESVTLCGGVKSIGDAAFEYDSLLSQITISDSVTSIGSKAFFPADPSKLSAFPPLSGKWVKTFFYPATLLKASRLTLRIPPSAPKTEFSAIKTKPCSSNIPGKMSGSPSLFPPP